MSHLAALLLSLSLLSPSSAELLGTTSKSCFLNGLQSGWEKQGRGCRTGVPDGPNAGQHVCRELPEASDVRKLCNTTSEE